MNLLKTFIFSWICISASAFAAPATSEADIVAACSAKPVVCKCIAKAHAAAAKNESKRQDRDSHMEWVKNFYKAEDPSELKKLSEQEPALSKFDEQVARGCVKANP